MKQYYGKLSRFQESVSKYGFFYDDIVQYERKGKEIHV
jgi:hypothetical protein